MSYPSKANGLAATAPDFAAHLSTAIRAYMARTNATMKMVARDVGAAESTVKGWASGYFPPGGENLIELARAVPEVRDLVLHLIGYQPTERERRVNEFMAEFQSLMAGK